MLKFIPTKGGSNQLRLWRRLNMLTPEIFLSYWKAVGIMSPLFDTTASTYQGWTDQNGAACEGMRTRVSGEKHGIVRLLKPSGDIIEASFAYGRLNGLNRAIFTDEIHIVLFKDHQEIAFLHLDASFKPLQRGGPQVHLLDDYMRMM